MKLVSTYVLVYIIICCFNWTCADPLKFEAYSGRDASISDQSWGYVDVRPGAHMFYWSYASTSPLGPEKAPLVMWLQGGPGGSGTGFGNFVEIGPLDVDLKPRNTTWLQVASLLFVDNPVGTGYSYVDSESDYTHNVDEIAADMMVLLKAFFMQKQTGYQSVPFYIFSESYGGKMTAAVSAALHEAIQKGDIKCNFNGFAMGDSWIHPISSTLAWGPYLYYNSLVDMSGLNAIDAATKNSEKLADLGKWTASTDAWGEAQDVVEIKSNGVNFYNILKWGQQEQSSRNNKFTDRLQQRILGVLHADKLSDLMNGPIKKQLNIPEKVQWGGQSDEVFKTQSGDFMKPITDTVNTLIQSTDLQVVVYSGQLDLIVSTIGTERWVYNLTIADDFQKAQRRPIYHPITQLTSGFVKSVKNFSFYWILDAGHMIPQDNPETALVMLKAIVQPRN